MDNNYKKWANDFDAPEFPYLIINVLKDNLCIGTIDKEEFHNIIDFFLFARKGNLFTLEENIDFFKKKYDKSIDYRREMA